MEEFCIDGACHNPIDPSQRIPPDETPETPWQIDDDPVTANATLLLDDMGGVTVRHP